MIRLKVINFKVILNKFIKIFLIFSIIIILLIFALNKIMSKFTKEKVLISILKNNILIFNTDIKYESGLKNMILSEILILSINEDNSNIDKFKKVDNIVEESDFENIEFEENNEKNNILLDNIDISYKETRVLEDKNKIDVFTDVYHSVKIRNESKYTLTEDMLKPDKISFGKNILIYHTHTCESYTPTEENNYIPSGNFRTVDLNYSVSSVGEILENNLKSFNLDVKHSKAMHDYPAYTGSYSRSLNTINNLLNEVNYDTSFVIDLHRDALGNNSQYGPCCEIEGNRVAQLMFVIGSDGGGLEHPNWIKNLKLAVMIQEEANLLYPGLFKPIILRNSRYNQHVSNNAFIIEVGATGNTLEEARRSMDYFSKILYKLIKDSNLN